MVLQCKQEIEFPNTFVMPSPSLGRPSPSLGVPSLSLGAMAGAATAPKINRKFSSTFNAKAPSVGRQQQSPRCPMHGWHRCISCWRGGAASAAGASTAPKGIFWHLRGVVSSAALQRLLPMGMLEALSSKFFPASCLTELAPRAAQYLLDQLAVRACIRWMHSKKA